MAKNYGFGDIVGDMLRGAAGVTTKAQALALGNEKYTGAPPDQLHALLTQNEMEPYRESMLKLQEEAGQRALEKMNQAAALAPQKLEIEKTKAEAQKGRVDVAKEEARTRKARLEFDKTKMAKMHEDKQSSDLLSMMKPMMAKKWEDFSPAQKKFVVNGIGELKSKGYMMSDISEEDMESNPSIWGQLVKTFSSKTEEKPVAKPAKKSKDSLGLGL